MSRYAVLSDIHGNLDALDVVLAHLEQRRVDAIWFLGDLVNYGPEPGKCIRRLLGQKQFPVIGVRGNNDQDIFKAPEDPTRLVKDLQEYLHLHMNEDREARINATYKSHLWSASQLTQEERALLEQLLLLETAPHVVDGAVLVHANPCNPLGDEGNYLRTVADAEEAFICDSNFQIGFFGHTHHAGVFRQFSKDNPYANVEHIAFSRFAGEMQEFPLDSCRVLINPGSVGQPRDGDWRAAYAIFDTSGMIEFYRIAYAREATIAKLHALDQPKVFDYLIQRLREAA